MNEFMNTSDLYWLEMFIGLFTPFESVFTRNSCFINTRNPIDVESFVSFNFISFGVSTRKMLVCRQF